MGSFALDDEGVPLWLRITECMRLLDTALMEAKQRGKAMVDAEAAYYTAKAQAVFELLESGYANTTAQAVVKGRPKVAEAMGRFHAAEVEYKNAVEAINVYKLKLRVLEAEYEREWSQRNGGEL